MKLYKGYMDTIWKRDSRLQLSLEVESVILESLPFFTNEWKSEVFIGNPTSKRCGCQFS